MDRKGEGRKVGVGFDEFRVKESMIKDCGLELN